MKNSPNISSLFKPIGRLVVRSHMTIFILIVLGGLIYAVLSISDMLAQASTDTSYVPNNSLSSFDPSITDQISKLHTSDQPITTNFPAGRINPFGE